MTSASNSRSGGPQTLAQKDKKRIDYILVIQEQNLPLIKQYIENLQVLGFEIENEIGESVDLIFIKLLITEEALRHFSQVYDIGNEKVRELTVLHLEPIFLNPFSTPISRVIPKNKGEITDAERIMIVHMVLQNTKYGDKDEEYGLSKLIRNNYLETAYPLHDGPITKEGDNIRSLGLLVVECGVLGIVLIGGHLQVSFLKGSLSTDAKLIIKNVYQSLLSRNFNSMDALAETSTLTKTPLPSLLFHHWSKISVMHKQQPLDLIYRYFGTEVAFYFAWLEYFNMMLIAPAILGCLTFIGSAAFVLFYGSKQLEEVCQDHDSYICPTCEGQDNCRFKRVSQYCILAHYSVFFDNEATVAFAVFMSFWVILFLKLWRRKESKLKMRWHTIDDIETEIRQPFADMASNRRRNAITAEWEPYTPKYVTVCRYLVTCLTWALLIGIIIIMLICIIEVQVLAKEWFNGSKYEYVVLNSKILTMILGAIAQVIAIRIFQMFYIPFAIRSTKYENPKTQQGFDIAVLYKMYLLSFANNYIPLFYLAFLKGALYTVPHENGFLIKDTCQPMNCILDLCIQLSFIMIFKDLLGNVLSLKILSYTNYLKKFWIFWIKRYPKIQRMKPKGVRIDVKEDLPQWEEEFYLEPSHRYLTTGEFTEMIIKYGFVTFFVAAFPLAPLCALTNNLLEMRSDAYKFVKLFRRAVPISKSGIGAWNGVLLSITYLSTATNAFVLAFTSDFVPRQVFRFNTSANLLIPGYFNSTLSYYNTDDYDKYSTVGNYVPYCFYRGYHNPADYPGKYEHSQEYWVNLTFRFVAIFIFEHFLLFCNGVLSYCIPNLPNSVVEQLDMDQQVDRTARFAEFAKHLEKDGKLNKDKFKSTIKYHRE